MKVKVPLNNQQAFVTLYVQSNKYIMVSVACMLGMKLFFTATFDEKLPSIVQSSEHQTT